MKKEWWDFNEERNYIDVNIQGNHYKVINKFPNYYSSASLLNYFHYLIIDICAFFELNYNKYSAKNRILIDCFLDIHPDNYYLSEMQLNTEFDGINKPRQIHLTNKPSVGKDGKLRAKYRHIFIVLRNKNGKFYNFNDTLDILVHELAHTMCNHVKWRDDDHGADFKNAEKLIINAAKNVM